MSSWRRRPGGTAPEAEGKLVPCPRPPPARRPAGRISSVLVNVTDVYAHIRARQKRYATGNFPPLRATRHRASSSPTLVVSNIHHPSSPVLFLLLFLFYTDIISSPMCFWIDSILYKIGYRYSLLNPFNFKIWNFSKFARA